MSKRIEERNLEQAVTLGCEPGVFLAVKVRTVKSKRIDANKGERIDRKVTLRGQRMRAKPGDASRAAKPNKTSISTTGTKAIGKGQLLKTKAAGKKNALAEKPLAVGEIIPSRQAKHQEQDSLQEIGTPAGWGASRELGSTMMGSTMTREMRCQSEALILDDNFEEKKAGTSGKEFEVTPDLVEMRQSTGLRWRTILHWLAGAGNWARRQLGSRQARKRLRVCESVSLGEKRFVAVIEVDGEQFLVGGASSSVATLARLEPSQKFSEVLKRRWAQGPVQA